MDQDHAGRVADETRLIAVALRFVGGRCSRTRTASPSSPPRSPEHPTLRAGSHARRAGFAAGLELDDAALGRSPQRRRRDRRRARSPWRREGARMRPAGCRPLEGGSLSRAAMRASRGAGPGASRDAGRMRHETWPDGTHGCGKRNPEDCTEPRAAPCGAPVCGCISRAPDGPPNLGCSLWRAARRYSNPRGPHLAVEASSPTSDVGTKR
jgi:hypothetical protein